MNEYSLKKVSVPILDSLHLLDDDAKKAIISEWSLEKRAQNGLLDEYLSLKEICDLLYPVPPKPRMSEYQKRADYKKDMEGHNNAEGIHNKYLEQLIKACKNSLLAYEGDIAGWKYQYENPHPLAKAGVKLTKLYIPDYDPTVSYAWQTRDFNRVEQNQRYDGYTCQPEDCTIHKTEFKRYLQSLNQWTLTSSSLLANWWPDDQMLTDTLDDAFNKLTSKKLPAYLDQNHPMFSEELNIAIQAWNDVLECNPDKPKRGSRKQLIENWLETHYKKTLPAEAKKRIATLLNPDKNGGAPSSD